MPETRVFRGQAVRFARKVVVKGKPLIKVILRTEKGQPGKTLLVTPQQYEAGLTRGFDQRVQPQQ